jgi:hypothetical protein
VQPSEISKLIGYIEIIDPRVAFDELKVLAWSKILNPHLNFDLAMEFANKHYGQTTEVLMPSHLNEYFKNYRNNDAQRGILQQFNEVGEERKPAEVERVAFWIETIKKKLQPANTDASNKPSEAVLTNDEPQSEV